MGLIARSWLQLGWHVGACLHAKVGSGAGSPRGESTASRLLHGGCEACGMVGWRWFDHMLRAYL